MPIRDDLKHLYGDEWENEIRPRILKRDGYKCKKCLKPDRATVFTMKRNGMQYWLMQKGGKVWRNEYGEYEVKNPPRGNTNLVDVVLSVCHLDHDSANMADENLITFCQYCHLMHDLEQHRATRMNRKDALRPILVAASGGELPPLVLPPAAERGREKRGVA